MKKNSYIYALILVIEIAFIGVVIWMALPYVKLIASKFGPGSGQTAVVESETEETSAPSMDSEKADTERQDTESRDTQQQESGILSEADDLEKMQFDPDHEGWISYTGVGGVDEVTLTAEGRAVYDKMKKQVNTYPDYLLEQVELYPEIIDFVYHYPEKEEYVCQLTEEEIHAVEMPLFLQWDKRWGYIPMGDTCIATAGCGPTCLSMICTYLMQSDAYSPEVMAEFAVDNRYYVTGQGSSWSLFNEGIPKLGLTSHSIGRALEPIIIHMEKELPAVVSLAEGDFTRRGHYVVICGMDGEDSVRVYDPNSRIRSSHSWKLEDLLAQTRNIWLISAD